MTDAEFIQEGARRGFQVVPLPGVIDHELRPGDRVVDEVPAWARRVADGAKVSEHFDFTPKPATIVAIASRADVLVRYDDGRMAFKLAKGLQGTPSVQLAHPAENPNE